ncbi:MAG: hypothetical protein J6A56_02930 [Clostridia bacterium]|nr:hypothetical protein [Clostridia bacterium]
MKANQWLLAGWNLPVTVSIRGKKMTFFPLKLAALAAGALVLLALLIQLLMLPAHRTRTIDLGFRAGSNYAMQPFQKELLLYNNQNMKVINHKGETRWSVDLSLSSPLVEQGGAYVLAADLAGNHAATLYRNGEVVRDYQITKDIISAKVNKKGTVAIATAADGYKGSVAVIDKKGRELFRWNSGDGYIMDLDISDNGHYLAVAQLSSEGAQADSKIQFIDLYQKKVIRTAERTGTIVGEVRFSGTKLLTVSDGELCGFSGNGKLLYQVSFAGKRPGKYDISSDEVLAFSAYDHLGNAVLELYNLRGKLVGSYMADSPVTTLAVCGDTVVAAKQRDVLQIKRNGKLKKQSSCNHDIKEVSIFGNGKACFAAGSTEADIIWMK